MKKRIIMIIAAAVIVFVVIGLKTGAGSSTAPASAEKAGFTPAEAPTTAAAAALYEDNNTPAQGSSGTSVKSAAAGETTAASPEPGNGSNAAAQRKLIRTVSLSVETKDFDALISGIQDHIRAAGGYIENSQINEGSAETEKSTGQRAEKSASITARVPADHTDTFVTAVEGEGNITSRSENASDITLQYADTESHIRSLKTEQERLWALIEKADTTEAILSIQQRLTDIEYQLDSCQSQVLLYDNQVSYATISMNIREVRIFTEKKNPDTKPGFPARMANGFLQTLSGLRIFLEDTAVGIASGLPVIALLLVIFLIVFSVVRHRRKKHAGKNPADGSSPHPSRS